MELQEIATETSSNSFKVSMLGLGGITFTKGAEEAYK